MKNPEPELLARVPSSSNPLHIYEIVRAWDGVVYCRLEHNHKVCPSWAFQKGVAPEKRRCKHIKALVAAGRIEL
jgi:hypothetical protein